MAWFAAVIPALSAASTGIAVASSISQANTAKKIGERNAKLDEMAAKAEQDQAARDEEALRRDNNQFFGRQRAAMAESGLGAGGSTGMLADQSAVLAELDALNIRYGGTMRGRGLLSQAANSRAGGRAAKSAGMMLAGAQLLAGSGDTYKQYKLSAG